MGQKSARVGFLDGGCDLALGGEFGSESGDSPPRRREEARREVARRACDGTRSERPACICVEHDGVIRGAQVDTDGNGRLEFREFIEMIENILYGTRTR